MLEIEINGKALEVEEGSTVLEAARAHGIYIPHFCYHKKLSIAANCRMCLVEIEKAPKPMPACATPVAKGMKVFTHSPMAVAAQKAVMEFLLINHPLDCPICDQGGECQLQDLAVGYGASHSRFREEKRVVANKDLGPLVATDMTRCINCTRCVRFTQEIAGYMELGQAYRGDRAEIMPFLGKTLDSELSGNVIDLCPVGALTSKPFRFSARSWELSRRRAVSPHDGLGSNLIVQVKHDRVYRVLPLENEAINECWLSDKDRFSYQGLNAEDRLWRPMLKQGGQWREVDWSVALDYAAHALRDIVKNRGADEVGALLSPHATLEEMTLATRLIRGLGSDNIDFRLRRCDFRHDGVRRGIPWLGMRIAEIKALDRVLVVGSFLRKDHPLLAQRLRQLAKRGAQISLLHATGDDPLIKLFAQETVPPSRMPFALAQIVKAAAARKDVALGEEFAAIEEGASARAIAESLATGRNAAIFLGNFAEQHPQATTLIRLAQRLAELVGGRFGFLGEAANSVGGYVAGAYPQKGGKDAARLLAEPCAAYLLVGAEPELDCFDGRAARRALEQAASVIALTTFKSKGLLDVADCLLPMAPFAETSGTFVSTEGRPQSFHAVCRAREDVRPGWKILRVLGNLLDLPGFTAESSEQVRDEVLAGAKDLVAGLDNRLAEGELGVTDASGEGLERIAEVPIYFADPLVRRAPALQATKDAAAPTARMSASTLAELGVADGETVIVGGDNATFIARLDASVPDGCVRLAAAHPSTVAVGPMFGQFAVRKA